VRGSYVIARPEEIGRVAPRSPQRTPDFLSSLLALSNFMRLSLMKAAHADVGGDPCRKSGYVGRNEGRSPTIAFPALTSKSYVRQ
jgi:hypothetical protein